MGKRPIIMDERRVVGWLLPDRYPSKSGIINYLNAFKFLFHGRKQAEVAESQIRRTRWAWDTEHNVLKPYMCELSSCRHESQVVSDAVPFLKERSLVQVTLVYVSQNTARSFSYYFGACRPWTSRAGSA
jgi:hypothetical protein